MQKKSLGKGLGALISGAAGRWSPNPAPAQAAAPAAAGESAGEQVEYVSSSKVVSSPMQPRKTFRDEVLTELMESIREHGVIQPLIVRRVGEKLELIAGERRLRACQKLGLSEVPVIVREASDRDVLEMALIENLQREDLNPIEESEAYCKLAQDFSLTQEEIAKRVGKNRATVANAMRLADLPEAVKSLVAQGRLSSGHAKAILGLKDPALQALTADQVVRGGLTVRQTERLVQRELGDKDPGKSKPATTKQLDAQINRLQNRLRDRLATHVSIHHGPQKGKIEIEYYGNDDLSRLLDLLGVKAE